MMVDDRPRIRDIAERAGVSQTTVSHALNSAVDSRVSDATRARVEKVALELGYRPNGLARALRTNRSYTLALISEEIATTPYAGRLILGAQEAASRHGWVLMLMTTGGIPGTEEQEIAAVWQHQVDGVLYAATHHKVLTVPESLRGKPVFVVNAESSDENYYSVYPDEFKGGYDATRALLDAGHERIGLINTAENMPARDGRLEGYRAALADAGIRYSRSLVSGWGRSFAEDGYQAMRILLARGERPTGVFCFNDRMAMGAYRAAAEFGMRVPQDISVVGFDNQTIIADALYPGLTTMALPYHEMGAAGVDGLIALIKGEAPEGPRARALPSTLVLRQSVATRA